MIKGIKQIHSKDIVLVKIGKFYYCYGKDAYMISYFFDYKLNLVENSIYSCGFPSQSLSKVIAKLESVLNCSCLAMERMNKFAKI